VLLAVAGVTGCRQSPTTTYPVSGEVTFVDGAPVSFGVVEFRSESGRQIARGKLDNEGRFTLGTFSVADGAVAGRHQAIVVQHFSPDQASVPAALAGSPHRPHQSAAVATEFASYERSGLAVQVDPHGANVVQLIVKRAPAPPAHAAAPR